jgi:crotonobetainyl-CoA:carnitine CoA-transferase CaiB-like acyl-CoA transferase
MSATKSSATKSRQNGEAPLQGLRVIDATAMIAGPLAAQVLADYGADVIKIEPRGGDLMRRAGAAAKSPDMGALYLQINRNKRSIVLDLKQSAARKALLRLVEHADVFITNTRPAAMRRLQLADEDLRKINPRLVYASLMGYGETGPYAGKPAYDDLIQGICALPVMIADAGGGGQAPRYAPMAMVDRIVGLSAAHAILAAIFRRDRSGEGQSVELPMFETMTQFVLGDHFAGRTFDPPIGKAGNFRMISPNRRPYPTRDGYVCALIYTDKHWKAFFEGLGRLDQYQANPHLAEFESRRQHPEETYGLISGALRDLATSEALALFERCDIPCAPMNDLDALIDDPHLAAVDFFQVMDHPTEGRIRYAGIPSRWNGAALPINRHAPRVGEHSVAILKEAGVPPEEIAALLASGATVDGALGAETEAPADALALRPN